ncbi:MAG: UvrD-helicase domain-containing protein [Prevotella sp.]|nr:UvrD-helicase domain-containing protein [Prevotella sp.]
MSSPLTVYTASAGSGKTFRLAVEYIKLLIDNPMNYRTILAVTFTNKATEEMKMRILSQLYGIWKNLSNSEIYLNTIVQEMGITREEASQKAGMALGILIHNYSYFRVETIDSFFQSILRNLARELDLTANLRIGLNDIQVEEQAVDLLIESLTRTDKVLQWIMSYIGENISDDKSWNVIGQVKVFGKTIFRDFYKEISQQLNQRLEQPNFFENYTKELRQIKQKAAHTMNSMADKFFETLDEHAITIDMLASKERGIASYFRKLQGNDWSDKKCLTSNLQKSMDSADNWVTKTSAFKEQVIPVVNDSLLPLLLDAERQRQRQWRLYVSADATLRHLNQLRLLGNIEQRVRQLNAEANRFLLSDTQQLLHELIGDSDSPFIFEKIGTQLEHIMIDEFQDTSTVQWKNFRLLLLETMSRGTQKRKGTVRNLIVGDVKQSIYRWRSADWGLLNDIDNQFADASIHIQHEPLKVNYRSERNVINFNNLFFIEAVAHELQAEQTISGDNAAKLGKAYQDVEQIVPEDRTADGLVRISLLANDDYNGQTLEQLAQTIEELHQQGIDDNKMAILVRMKRYIPVIADYFNERLPNVKLVSDEAFRLDASMGVGILVTALTVLVRPDDVMAKATLAKAYQRHIRQNNTQDNSLFEDLTQLDALLPEAFTANTQQLASLPLYELCERLYDIFQLSLLTDESAYACTFFDVVSAFSQENNADISSFLNEWESTLFEKTIQSDEVNGIRIISIHKSKGLEFDNVLIPFCDWQLEKTQGNTLWCDADESPFNQLPKVPVDYSARLLDSVYDADYREEHLQNTVDNINLLYVAFTRAKKNLFVWAKANAKNSRSATIQAVLPAVAEKLKEAELTTNDDKSMLFEYGMLSLSDNPTTPESTNANDDKEKNVFLKPVTPQRISIETFESKAEFRQSNASRDFVNAEADEPDKQQTYIKMGCVMHNLLSSICTTDDVDSVLAQFESEGILYNDIPKQQMHDMLRKRLAHPQVAEWFSNKWQLFNECAILSVDEDSGAVVERRPDRVMTDGNRMIVVDFKFGKPIDDHKTQVQRYMHLLRQMGHQNVEGYLWYVYTNKIERV